MSSEIVALGIFVTNRQLTFYKKVFSRSIRDRIRIHAVAIAIRNNDDRCVNDDIHYSFVRRRSS